MKLVIHIFSFIMAYKKVKIEILKTTSTAFICICYSLEVNCTLV